VGYTSLSGNIPTEIGKLINLKSLGFQGNPLMTGGIPSTLANMIKLESFAIALQQGMLITIPSELGHLTNLRGFNLEYVNIAGSIPVELGKLYNLTALTLAGSNVSGNIPEELGNLVNLSFLHLNDTRLSGSIPQSFTKLNNLTYFNFYNTGLCEPSNDEFQRWLKQVYRVEGTNKKCGQSGFQPNPNGWGFANTGYEITWQNFKDTFGVENVEWNGIRRPSALNHFFHANPASRYSPSKEGNCYGMVTAAALRFTNSIPLPYGITTDKLFSIPEPESYTSWGSVYWKSSPITDYIVKYQGYKEGREQKNEEVIAQRRTLTETLDLIKFAIDTGHNHPYALALRGADESHGNKCVGHVVLPVSYTEEANTTLISTYNPNRPGTVHEVRINPKAGTWEFNEPEWGRWNEEGTCIKGLFTTLDDKIYALSLAYDTHQPIPNWDFAPTIRTANTQTPDIRQLFASNNVSVTVHGSKVTPIIPYLLQGQDSSYPQRYLMDADVPISVSLTHLQNSETNLTLFDPYTIMSIDGIATQGTSEAIDFAATTNTIILHSTEKRDVTFITGEESHEYQVGIKDVDLTGGNKVEFVLGNGGAISITTTLNQESYQAHFLQAGINGTSEFTVMLPSLVTGDIHTLQPNWVTSSVLLKVDETSDGTINQEVVITPGIDSKKLYLPLITK
jgi:hypothetical protein